MKKILLINNILKQDPVGAWNCRGKFVGHKEYVSAFGDWTMPYRKYVNCEIKNLGTTGGPSEATINDYKYKWNKKELFKAKYTELLNLKNATIKENEVWENIFKKYSSMSLLEFLMNHKECL